MRNDRCRRRKWRRTKQYLDSVTETPSHHMTHVDETVSPFFIKVENAPKMALFRRKALLLVTTLFAYPPTQMRETVPETITARDPRTSKLTDQQILKATDSHSRLKR